MKKVLLSMLLIAVPTAFFAQSKANVALPNLSQSDFTIVERDNDGSIKSVRYAMTDPNIPATANEFFNETLKERETDDFVFDRSKETNYGMYFERYQQYYHGVKVDDGHYNFRFKNGRMKVVKGHYVNVTGINPVPSITENEAINLYMSYFGIEKGNVLETYADLLIKEVSYTDRKGPVAVLTYRIFLRTPKYENSYVGYIDAHTGRLLYKEEAYVNYSATGQFYTYYNRNNSDTPKSGTTEYINNMYQLKDTSRGYGIIMYKQISTGYVEIFDQDNVWTRSEIGNYNIALDVHWTMEQIYDIMNTLFTHDGYDGYGGQIQAIINDDNNAYFSNSGKYFFFGYANGSSVNGPIASVDVVGHEYGHALLYNSANFSRNKVGSTQNPAIDEGLADIWGIIFEKHITPSADYWKTGEQIMINGNSSLRNFQNPGDLNAYTQIASTYGCGAFNSSDPHIVGGLLPYWFYLLTDGGSGTNGYNNSFQLLPVGFNLAESLFTAVTLTSAYLEDCTSFQDVADAFVEAGEDIGNAFLLEQVKNALYAVGLYYEPSHIYYQSPNTYYVYGNSSCLVSWSFTNVLPGPSPTIVPNSSNYSCNVYGSSSFGGYLNATIYCGGSTVTYSRYITGTASPSSVGDDNMQVNPIDGTHYQLSLDEENVNGYLEVYDATSLRLINRDKIENENYVLDTSSWRHGLYIVKITTGNKTYTTKLSIK